MISYNSSVFEVFAGQDFNVSVTSNVSEASSEISAWKKLNNEEWPRIYSTSWVPGYGDIALVVDKVSFEVLVHQNWTYSLEAPSHHSCGWSSAWIHDGKFDLTLSYTPKSRNLELAPAQSSRLFMSVDDLRDNFTEAPALNWPQPYLIEAGNATKSVWELCPDDGWLHWESAFHVQHARAKVHHLANRVQVAIPFLAIVIASNIAKVIGIYFTIKLYTVDRVISVGDAVASFLEHPEPATKDKCTLKKSQLCVPDDKSGARPWKASSKQMVLVLGGTRVWSATIM